MRRIKPCGFAAALSISAVLHPQPALADAETDPAAASAPPATDAAAAPPTATLAPVEVTARARRLNEARTGIQTQSGASTYTIDSAAIAAMPGGDNTLLNQVLLQAPDVAQDSFGQFHVRGEHNGLQYRLDGIILPEGISVFGQSLDPRLISSVTLVTGALPAEYGLRTAGIIDVKTRSGAIDPGGSISLYGGSHGTAQPSISYAGSAGRINYFVSGDYLRNDLGIESPDGSSNPLHDQTRQGHGFAFVEDVLDDSNRVAAAFGTSVGTFQIPNLANQQPALGLDVDGQTAFSSADLNEKQRELTDFGFISLQHSHGALNWQASVISRYSALSFTPDPLGDLLFNGIAQTAYKRNIANALQLDGADKLDGAHTLRAGAFVQRDTSTSNTTSQVLPTDALGIQASDVPVTIVDNGDRNESIESVYVQDEWSLARDLTVNYGLRFDRYTAFSSGHQLSPRLNTVWQVTPAATVHAGYSRFFSPPPFELVGNESVARFAGTTGAPAVGQADTPKAERASYFDVGYDQVLAAGLTAGIDTYYKRSRDLIDEGQFGAPIILTPFNYVHGRQYGVELKLNYAGPRLSMYANLAAQSAKGEQIESAQFNFSAADLAYIANHYIDLDHEQRYTASAGTSYLWHGTRFSGDLIYGAGLRADLALPDGTDIPNGEHLPYYTQVNLGASHVFEFDRGGSLTLRFDIINALDKTYQIRNGTGVGVGAPQYGPRRGVFFGVSKSI